MLFSGKDKDIEPDIGPVIPTMAETSTVDVLSDFKKGCPAVASVKAMVWMTLPAAFLKVSRWSASTRLFSRLVSHDIT